MIQAGINRLKAGLAKTRDNLVGQLSGLLRVGRKIDEELMEAYRGTVSLPFEPGGNKRIAVKIVDDRGIESLRIIEVE